MVLKIDESVDENADTFVSEVVDPVETEGVFTLVVSTSEPNNRKPSATSLLLRSGGASLSLTSTFGWPGSTFGLSDFGNRFDSLRVMAIPVELAGSMRGRVEPSEHLAWLSQVADRLTASGFLTLADVTDDEFDIIVG